MDEKPSETTYLDPWVEFIYTLNELYRSSTAVFLKALRAKLLDRMNPETPYGYVKTK